MEHNDILDDLFSWTESKPESSHSGADGVGSQPQRQRPSLQESCVNTAVSKAERAGNSSNRHHAPSSSLQQSQEALSGDAEVPTRTAFSLPPSVAARLFDHQRAGVQWLYTRHCKSRACLLADEMGLGKTVQVAAFLGEMYRRRKIKTTIVVVPPTLVPMWEAAFLEWGVDENASGPCRHTEAATDAGLRGLVEVIHGDSRKRRQARWRKLRYGLPCVLLTTYGVLRQDAAEMSATLVDYVILDEAHLIKDASTSAFKSALSLSARHKIALTGTPLMNSFEDMWSIFRFMDGSILELSKADFTAVSATLLRGNERDATAGQRETAQAELTKLQAAIRPFMLRREKRDLAHAVASEKRDVVVWVRLTEVQQLQYEAFLESKEVSAARSTNTDSTDPATNPLLLLTLLSQICNHPWLNLVDAAFTTALAQPYTAPLSEMGDVFAGAKLWVALRLLVRCVGEGRKALVFSRSKRLLHLLGCLLSDWRVPHTHVDGDTSSEQRFAAVRRFNDDPTLWVCLLTTQVGGVGLTFTSASAVVLLDPSWNPSADAQAVDRVHRIGQARDVVVYRLVTCGTVEEKVYRNQIFKRMAALQSLATAAAEEPGDSTSAAPAADEPAPSVPSGELYRYFTRLQLRSMFVMDTVDHSSTAEQLEMLHPGRVDAHLRAELCSIDGVCDVSDNGCVLTEEIDTDGAEADVLQACAPSSASLSADSDSFAYSRRRLRSHSSRSTSPTSVSSPLPSQSQDASPAGSQRPVLRRRVDTTEADWRQQQQEQQQRVSGGPAEAVLAEEGSGSRQDSAVAAASICTATPSCDSFGKPTAALSENRACPRLPRTSPVGVLDLDAQQMALQQRQHLFDSSCCGDEPQEIGDVASEGTERPRFGEATEKAEVSRIWGCTVDSSQPKHSRPSEEARDDQGESVLAEPADHIPRSPPSPRQPWCSEHLLGDEELADYCSSAEFASCRSSF